MNLDQVTWRHENVGKIYHQVPQCIWSHTCTSTPTQHANPHAPKPRERERERETFCCSFSLGLDSSLERTYWRIILRASLLTAGNEPRTSIIIAVQKSAAIFGWIFFGLACRIYKVHTIIKGVPKKINTTHRNSYLHIQKWHPKRPDPACTVAQ